MMELTKEEVQEALNLSAGHTLSTTDAFRLHKLARQLLAGLEQDPVAYYFPGGEREIEQVSLPDDIDDGQKANCIPLYAAPQLPQPSVVSDEMINTFEAEFRRTFKVSDGVEQLIEIDYQGEKFSLSIRDAATWWKLGRATILKHSAPFIVTSDPCMMEMPKDEDIDTIAAMLQGAEQWIPCSERMPIENDIVLVVDDGYFVCEAQYREGDFFSAARGKGEFFETTCRDVELWMPLPAAPQQEVATDNTTQQFESLGLIVTSDERKMELPRCSKHPETELQVHPFEQLLSYPPQPAMYCPLCKPSVAEWVKFDKQLRSKK